MKNTNPVFNNEVFTKPQHVSGSEVMTVNGTMTKSFYLLFLVLLSSVSTWLYLTMTHNFQSVTVFSALGSIVSLILAFVIMFKPTSAPVTAPLYAVFQGFALGSVTTLLSTLYGGIALQAVALTMGVTMAMLVSYKLGLIKATEKFRSIVTTATFGICLFYLATMVLRFFNISFPFLHSGIIGIIISLVVVGVAALNLILDFDNIEQGARQGAPAYMEWVGAFGLMVTLIWLYWEILRLISILRGDD